MLIAILLAAGRGRRLGQPKAGMMLQGRTALQRCVDALRQGGIDEVRAVVDGRHSIQPASGAVMIEHPDADRGQTSSLKCGLAAGPLWQAEPSGRTESSRQPGHPAAAQLGDAEAFVVHTVDRPLLTAGDVRALRLAFEARPSGARILAPSVSGRRGHPAFFEAELAAEFLELGDSDPAHRVMRRDPSRVQHLVMQRPWLVRDIDTPADLAAAEAALSRRARPARGS